jgi:outer membrane protein assembly factor BamB
MKTIKNRTKNVRFPGFIALVILIGLLLSSCTGAAAVNNWPGVSANQNVVYLSYQAYVYAVNADSGTMIWRFPKDKADPNKPFFAAPSFGPDGLIVVGNYGNVLYGLNNNGDIQWQFTAANAHFVASPLVLEDVILAPASDNSLYALSMDGTQRWKYQTSNMLWAQPASDGELVFQPGMDHFLYALRLSDGSLAWKRDLKSSLVSAPVVGDDGSLFINTMSGEVLALNPADGTEKWSFPTQGSLWSAPVFSDGTLFVGTSANKTQGKVLAISAANGAKVWEVDAGSPVVGGGALLQDAVAFPTEGGSLISWSMADGKQEWTQPIGGKLYSTPVVVNDKLVVAVTQGENKVLQAVNFNGQISWPFALPK